MYEYFVTIVLYEIFDIKLPLNKFKLRLDFFFLKIITNICSLFVEWKPYQLINCVQCNNTYDTFCKIILY